MYTIFFNRVQFSAYTQRFCIWLVACKLANYFLVEPQARFLNFTIYFFSEIVKFKNLATFQICHNFDLATD